MSNGTSSITRLLSVTNEIEAAAIVAALGAHDIVARYDGAYTAGFQAEAPGMIQILVREEDLARATDVVEAFGDQAAVIDWSTVDCGDDEPLSDDEQDVAAPQNVESRPLQVSLRTLLIIQTTVCVLLAFSQSSLVTALFSATTVAVVYAFSTFGIVQIISKRERAAESLRFVMSSFVVLLILLFAMQLF
jgi:hypothetical protein